MAKVINYNALNQILDTTFGRSSTPQSASYSVKFSFSGGDRLLATYIGIINFPSRTDAMIAKKSSEEEVHNQICEFFHSYAVSWRTKEKREKAEQSLFMDVHAPPPARVNNIVRQFDDWYTCFNIKPGDKLYTSPDERIRIF